MTNTRRTNEPTGESDSDSWAVRFTEPGQPSDTTESMPRAEADGLCAELTGAGWPAEVIDLLAEVRTQFPVGLCVQTSTGQTATVELCPPNNPITQGKRLAHHLMRFPTEPIVYLGAPTRSWFVARHLHPVGPDA